MNLLNATNLDITTASRNLGDGAEESLIIDASVRQGTIAVDRLFIQGWSLGKTSKKTLALASRLINALRAGMVFEPYEVKRDVYGRTYISAMTKIRGRYLNADLRRLGF